MPGAFDQEQGRGRLCTIGPAQAAADTDAGLGGLSLGGLSDKSSKQQEPRQCEGEVVLPDGLSDEEEPLYRRTASPA